MEFKEVPDNRHTPLIAMRFRGRAFRVRARKPKIVSWDKLKKHMRFAFLTFNYECTMYQRLQNLRQGNRMVDEHASEFFLLLMCNEITETNAQLVSRFIGGLR